MDFHSLLTEVAKFTKIATAAHIRYKSWKENKLRGHPTSDLEKDLTRIFKDIRVAYASLKRIGWAEDMKPLEKAIHTVYENIAQLKLSNQDLYDLKSEADKLSKLSQKNSKVKSRSRCPPKDPAQFSSPSPHKRGKKPIFCLPKISVGQNEKKFGAQFSSLCDTEKFVRLEAVSFALRGHQNRLIRARKERKERLFRGLYLNKKEIAMIGEMDGKEADNTYHEAEKRPHEHLFFVDYVRSYRNALLKAKLDLPCEHEYDVWSQTEKVCADKIVVSDILESRPEERDCSFGKIDILKDNARSKEFERCESYVMNMEMLMSCESDDKKLYRKKRNA